VLAQALLAAAGTRTESRGCHRRTDFPDRDDVWQRESLEIGLDGAGAAVVRPALATMNGSAA
jgi:L-aspartate oxidase